jgi:hypothetical protein
MITYHSAKFGIGILYDDGRTFSDVIQEAVSSTRFCDRKSDTDVQTGRKYGNVR